MQSMNHGKFRRKNQRSYFVKIQDRARALYEIYMMSTFAGTYKGQILSQQLTEQVKIF